MTRPVVSSLTERIYELLEPLQGDDEAYGYGLLVLTSAAAAMMESTVQWVGDGEEEPWQRLVSEPDLGGGTPNEYLAQLLGMSVRLMDPGLVLFIMNSGLAHMRGTTQYLEAILDYLMGEDAVGIYERRDASLNPNATHIVIRTRGELTEQAQRVVERWKPAGLVAHVIDDPGPTFFDIAVAGLTFDEFEAEITTFDSVVDWVDTP